MYLGGSTELKLTKSSGTVSGLRYINAIGATAVRSSDGTVHYLLTDHHGTAQESVNASTLAATRRKFTFYGQPRGTSPLVWPGEKGFVGGTTDGSTGLTHLGAREYDPDTGRFISVDPVIDHGEPQQMHGYAYANNSPVTFTDPSGLRFCADECQRGDSWEETSGGYHKGKGIAKSTTPPAGGKKESAGPSEADQRKARAIKKKTLLDVVLQYGGDIVMEVMGINDIRDCATKGDIKACMWAVVGMVPIGKIAKAGKIIEAGIRAIKGVLKWMDEVKWAKGVLRRADEAAAATAKQADDTAAAAARQGDDAAGTGAKADDAGGGGARPGKDSCEGNSFTPDTEVVMADGSTKPIEDVELGDEVLATDPETGKTEARKVVRLIVGQGKKDLVEVTVDTDGKAGDQTGTVIATDGHPFWVQDLNAWVDAKDLKPGNLLRTSAGTYTQITAIRPYTAHQRVHNLTIADIHTYHVTAGTVDTLVHNCNLGTVSTEQSVQANRAAMRINGQDGFSGVYEPASGRIHAEVSGGANPLVNRYGGHGEINERIFGDSRSSVGFVAVLGDGVINMTWRSGSVNVRNFGRRGAPEFHRNAIMSAMRQATGLEVRG